MILYRYSKEKFCLGHSGVKGLRTLPFTFTIVLKNKDSKIICTNFCDKQKPDDQRSSHSRVNADDVIEQIFSG